MGWYDEQQRKDRNGRRWHFRVWFDVWTEDKVLMAQRVFFWDDTKAHSGVVLLKPGSEVHFSRVKKLIEKLLADPALRREHYRELHFPLERHYSDYGVFPEEISSSN